MKSLLTCVAVTSLFVFQPSAFAAPSSEKLLPEQLPIELGAGYIPDRETFLTLAHIGAERGSKASKDVELMKFVVEIRPEQPILVYWMNTNNYQKHPNFMNAVGIDFSFGGASGRSGGKGGEKEGRTKGSTDKRGGKNTNVRDKQVESTGSIERGERGSEIAVSRNVGKKISVIDHYDPSRTSTVLRADMSYLADVEAPDGSLGVYTFNLDPNVPIELLSKVYQAILLSFPAADGKLAYRVSKETFNNQRSQYLDAGVHVYSDVEMYTSLNEAVSFGKLVFLSEQEQPNPNDIVIAKTLPNTMPRVAGVITSIRQTPLSHVNLRAVQDNIPNSYIANVLTSEAILALVGQYVRYEVTSEGYSLRAASLDEVTDYFTSRLPKKGVELQPDLSQTEILSLDSLSFHDAKSIGVKAANLAELRRVGLPEGTIPDGFAVPFYFYDAFMRFNGFYADVDALMADDELKKDPKRLQKALKAFQKRIKRATFPEELMNKLAEVQARFPAGQSMRTRSSTNNEDLEGFSGAGLYDSYTHHLHEGHLSKSIKQVYASLWNFRAFEAREFNGVNHKQVAMGVLIHPNFKGELANGVAVSEDVLYSSPNTLYINAQVGEDLVTNPEALSTPEELLVARDTGKGFRLLNASSTNKVILETSEIAELRDDLKRIEAHFKPLYQIKDDQPFALEVEFKITADEDLVIKQVRPWVF
ncbi:PEP/pyruvate-binding domain-containing protein [Marinomonas ostreistagni]|uniref:Phosphoenolpyruvate synthase n=1 Tax=Marinomonas ostreistagni TaxID=359209 RepID=A0ABS0ZBC7_9GAMM|nr:PEP/pyruvate-binding domain-containing protein [Marinomonas ostreistagni]MBJ7550963.1 hypothetical protein [Marinomonas ostreistagni]